jgi:hypothetical protein
MTMRRLLIALLALMLSAVSLAAPAQAQGSWTCTYDFSSGTQGWSGVNGSHNGSAWTTADIIQGANYRRNVEITLSFSSTTITSFSVSGTYSAGSFDAAYTRAYLFKQGPTTIQSTTSSPSMPYSWTGSQAGITAVSAGLTSSVRTTASYSGSASITSITLTGTGTTPCSPTPTPVPSATVVPTATPIIINTFATPTPIAIDGSGIYEALQQGNNSVIGLPADLAAAGRPPDEDGSEIFAYVKWFVSPSSADELAGPFAPIVSHTGIFLALVFAMTVIYAVVWAAVWLLKFVVWVFKLITGNLVLSVIFIVVAAIGAIVMLLTKILEAIK